MGDPQHACPVDPRHGHQRQGFDRADDLPAADGVGPDGRHVHQPAPRARQRAHLRNGEPISDEDFAEQIAAIADLEVLVGVRPSYFEILTAAAFRWFADVAVDVAVIEVGLLGRWDATNVVDAAGRGHHQHRDGPHRVRRPDPGRHRPREGRHHRARQSAAIVGETDPELVDIFRDAGGATMLVRGDRLRDDEQPAWRSVAACSISARRRRSTPTCTCRCTARTRATTPSSALTAVETFFAAPLAHDVVTRGSARSSCPAGSRCSVISRSSIVDGAHNPAGADTCAGGVLRGLRSRRSSHPRGRHAARPGGDAGGVASRRVRHRVRLHRAVAARCPRRPTSPKPPAASAATTSRCSTRSRQPADGRWSTPTATTRSWSPAASTPSAPPAPSSNASPTDAITPKFVEIARWAGRSRQIRTAARRRRFCAGLGPVSGHIPGIFRDGRGGRLLGHV